MPSNLRQVTPQEVTAARLREMGRDLISKGHDLMVQADAIEAGVHASINTGARDVLFIDPLSGNKSKIKRIQI